MYTYRKHVLDNGLRVVSIQMPYLHSVLISMFVKVGGRFERDEERGLSHFLEHVLLNGTEHYPSSHELVEAVENIGGELNGLTSYEYGLYWLRTHHDHFDTGMRIFADIFNAPLFDATEIEGERQIILEEVHGYSQEGLGYLLLDLLWPQCAHKFNTLGDIENVEEFTQQDLMEHFRRFYVPQNMVLCMAGNFDAEQAEDLAAALFHDLCGEPDLAAEELGDPLPGPRWTSRPYGGTQTNFMLTHRAFSYRHPDRTRLQVFNTLLGIGTGSVLFETVREKLGLTYSIGSKITMYSDFGTVDITCNVLHENLSAALEAILGEINRLIAEGIPLKKLAQVEGRVRCWMEFKLDSPEEMSTWFGLGELLLGPERIIFPEEEAELVGQMTSDELCAMVRDIFVPERRYLAIMGPEGQLIRRREITKILESSWQG